MTRDEAIKELKEYEDGLDLEYATPFDKAILYAIKALDQEPQTFKWCTDCREYDQEKHCCHRWSKVIRDTVEEMKQEQEPILDKIRAEIESQRKEVSKKHSENDELQAFYNGLNDGLKDARDIIDQYKAESEAEDRTRDKVAAKD